MFDLGRSSRALLLALLLAPAPEAAAQSPTWAKTTTGCQIWDPWGASETLSWSGPCTAGKATGKGTLQRGRGAAALAYDGTLRDGRAHGPGRITWADGAQYNGNWQDSQRAGRGTQIFASGNRYEGDWRVDVPHGRGTLTTTTGLRYEGDWKDGQRTGHGDFTMRDGTRYTGGWLNGKQEGQGTQVFANGSRYEGQWRGGLPNGPGTGYGAVTGRIFRGTFRNGCLRTDQYTAAFGVPDAACQ